MLLHHSQTHAHFVGIFHLVWYLMLLHHSQTNYNFYRDWRSSGILCFYIILKHRISVRNSATGLVSYAFTSFSNVYSLFLQASNVWYLMLLHHSQTFFRIISIFFRVWYLMLLHHSQTWVLCSSRMLQSGILCFYIILKPQNRKWTVIIKHKAQDTAF